MRQFRIDRIRCCIDHDGEVFEDVPAFLVQTFGMSPALAAIANADEDRWDRVLQTLRADAVLLNALSRSDTRMRDEEVEVAVVYLTRLYERSGEFLEAQEVRGVERYFRRLRPQQHALAEALGALANRSPDEIRRFLVTAQRLMDADGKRHPAEIELINDIALDLTGLPLV